MRGFSLVPVLTLIVLGLIACEGPSGPPGPPGDDDIDGGVPTEVEAGLVVTIEEATIDGSTASTVVRFNDGEGNALDRTGAGGTGEISVSFVLAHLGRDGQGNATTYTSYTTRVQTVPDGGPSAVQAAGESDGTWEDLGNGRYRYTFSTSIDVADATETHTVGVYGERDAPEGTSFDDATFDFVPAGGDVAYRREVVDDATCNRCHQQLAFHGGSRRSVDLCILCHSPQTVDPDTGNTVDMRVMIHKIHRGNELPSVEAGTPYQIVGFMQSVHDYSTVAYPTPNTVSNCQSCHTGDHWRTNFAVDTCTACHDRTWFGEVAAVPEGWEVHGGGPQPEENCDVCHAADLPGLPPTSVVGAHEVPQFAPDRAEPELAIVSVTDTGPGDRPIITFTVAVQGEPRDILASPLSTLRATFAGPNTDFARYWQSTIQGTGAGGELVAGASPGEFVWTAPATAAIPQDATGSYTAALESNLLDENDVRITAHAPMMAIAVTDDTPQPRREIIDSAKCDDCHGRLTFHGGNRANAQYCSMCHNPNNVNEERIARVEGQEVLVHTVQLTNMIHRIHMGEELSQPYVLGGNPTPNEENPQGTQHDFAEVRYPAPHAACAKCHLESTQVLTDDTTGLLPAFDQVFACSEEAGADEDMLCEPFSPTTPESNAFAPVETIFLYPQTAACTGCHDAPSTLAHAMTMTAPNGVESCETCHGAGGEFEAHGAE